MTDNGAVDVGESFNDPPRRIPVSVNIRGP